MKKVSKTSVHYRPGNEAKHCNNCVMFSKASRTCDLVLGDIAPMAVCDKWEAKDDRSVQPGE